MHPSGLTHIFHITMLRSLEKSAVETGSGEKKELLSMLTAANGFITINTNKMYLKKLVNHNNIEKNTEKRSENVKTFT